MKKFKGLAIKNSILRFWFSYSIVLLCPLVLSMLGYRSAFAIMERDIKETQSAMINHSISMIDNQFKALNTISLQIAGNSQISALAEIRSSQNKSLFWDATESIEFLFKTLNYSYSHIYDNIYLYLGNTDYIVTSSALYQAPFYYESILNRHPDSFANWKDTLLSSFKYASYIKYDNMHLFVQSIPIAFNKPVMGAVIATLNEREITRFFDYVETDKGAYFYIQTPDGTVVAHNAPAEVSLQSFNSYALEAREGVLFEKRVDDNKIIVYATSNVNNWRYTLVLPEKITMQKLLNLQRMTWFIFSAALVMGALISLYLSIRSGKPLNMLLNEIKKGLLETESPPADLNNLEKMGITVSEIISKNKLLKDELEKQQPLLQTAFLQKIIRGEFSTEKEMQALAQRASLSLSSSKYLLVVFRIFPNLSYYDMDNDTLEEVNVISLLIRNQLKEAWLSSPFFHEADHLTTAVILGMDTGNVAQAYKLVKTIHEGVYNDYRIIPQWGISKLCDAPLKLWRAYEQAKIAMNAVVPGEASKSIIIYDSIEASATASGYYYPEEFEQRLISFTRTGDKENQAQLIRMLEKENFEKRSLTPEMIKQFYHRLYKSLHLLMENLPEGETAAAMPLPVKETEEIPDMSTVKGLFESIGERFTETKQNRQTKLINKIIQFIDKEYTDPNLCLAMVAAKFSISGSYISGLFKEQAHINFMEYVENLRINKACDLLKDSEYSINLISVQVGYNSVQSFRRAFKRIKGYSPSEVRK